MTRSKQCMDLATNGKMAKKLLTKTLRANMLVSALILMVSAPLFYWITEGLAIEDSDEALHLLKKEFLHYTLPTLQIEDIASWNRINRDLEILPADGKLTNDTTYGASFYDTLDAENEPYRVLLAPVRIHGRPYTFMARMNQIESEDFIQSIALLFVLVIFLSLSGMYLITRWQSQRLWETFYATLTIMENFNIEEDQSILFGKSSTVEFERLNVVLGKLLAKNRTVFAAQREFVDHAAHELQTPLAILQTQIDMMMQRPDLNQGQGEMLEKLESAIHRLLRLHKNLLLLSKLDSSSYAVNEEVSLLDILRNQLPFFQEQAAAHQIAITMHLDQDLQLVANSTLVEIAVGNLFFNAIRHNIIQGNVDVKVSEGRLRITNTGLPDALPAEQLFKRFSKIISNSQGNGLGLAIVKKIADLNEWRVSYSFVNQCHQFTIDFKHH
jgi:two-component system, OmpR family, sensor histidine kinase ArlS